MATTTDQKKKTMTKSSSSSPLAEDLQVMCALGGFMFLINEMRDLAQGKRVKDDEKNPEDAEKQREQNRQSFERIMSFPLDITDIQPLILNNKSPLVKVQGEQRYQWHLDMCSFLLKDTKNDSTTKDIEQGKSEDGSGGGGPRYVNYTDQAAHDAVYSIVVDHPRKRVVVVWRGSVTKEDWEANLTVAQSTLENPQYAYHNKWNGTTMKIHTGFYNYIFQPIKQDQDNDVEEQEGAPEGGDENVAASGGTNNENEGTTLTLFDVVVKDVTDQLEQYPNYEVFTTGVSLGGALTTVFAFFFAADTKLPKITCYSFASPKLGNLGFRKACQNYEYSGQLRLLRVANQHDPVVSLPRRVLTICPCYVICPCFTYIAMCCTCFVQTTTYRHVGVLLLLPEKPNDKAVIGHAGMKSSCCRTLLSDWGKLFKRGILLWCHFFHLLFTCSNPTTYRDFHGYPAYWQRVEEHVSDFDDELTLDLIYEEIFSEEKWTHVTSRFM